jgi:hypothetical protein
METTTALVLRWCRITTAWPAPASEGSDEAVAGGHGAGTSSGPLDHGNSACTGTENPGNTGSPVRVSAALSTSGAEAPAT